MPRALSKIIQTLNGKPLNLVITDFISTQARANNFMGICCKVNKEPLLKRNGAYVTRGWAVSFDIEHGWWSNGDCKVPLSHSTIQPFNHPTDTHVLNT